MKKIIIVFALVLNLFASDDYIPLSNLSQEQKEEYNFVNKNIIVETKEDNTNYAKKEEVKQKEEVLKPINKELVKEYKKDIPMPFTNQKEEKFMGIIQGISSIGRLRVLMDDDSVAEFDIKEIQMLY